MNAKELATQILPLVGGELNISAVNHCATRLRIQLKEDSLAQIQEIDQLEGVLRAQVKGGQLQIVIGAKVTAVYDAFLSSITIDMKGSTPKDTKKKNFFNMFFEMITSIITPILAPLIGCGMIKSLALIITTFGWLAPTTGFMVILNMIGDSLFYFFPFFLAVSAAKRFKTNMYMALTLAACLMHPTILDAAKASAQTGISAIEMFNMSIPLVKYSSTLIPIIFSVWVLSKVHPFIDKYVPDMLKLILTPLLTFLIMVPLELIVIGPMGFYGGNIVGEVIQNFYTAGGIVSGFVLGCFRPVLVMFGMHYAIQPIMLQQLSDFGYTTLGASTYAANLAQAGAVLAVVFMTRDKKMKSAASSAGVSALLGITEPAIYGVNLKYKKPFIAGCLAAGIVSACFTFFDVKLIAFVMPSLLSVSALETANMAIPIIGCIAAIVLGFVFAYIAGIKEISKDSTTSEITANANQIQSPLIGVAEDIAAVKDKIFSQEVIGKGIAIEPTVGSVYAPFDGRIETLFKTKHAIGLVADDGIELLIHIGIDTVNLNGEFFTAHMEQGQRICKGDLIMEFDIESIHKAGYETITPIVITNSNAYKEVMPLASGLVNHDDAILAIIK